MADKVPLISIIFMIISGLIAIGIPVILLICFKIRKNADFLPFFVGAAVMLVFALILESGVHRLVFGSAAGEKILGSPWLYALYGGLMAALFEETGRFAAFKTVLKKNRNKDVNALMYGAGHGGFESAALMGTTAINNVVYSIMINTGQAETLKQTMSGEVLAQFENAIRTLLKTPSYEFLMGGIERIFAIALQISLSVLVWFAVKKKGKGYLFPLAIFIHFFVDAVTAFSSQKGVPSYIIEIIIGALTVIVVLTAKKIWVREASPRPSL